MNHDFKDCGDDCRTCHPNGSSKHSSPLDEMHAEACKDRDEAADLLYKLMLLTKARQTPAPEFFERVAAVLEKRDDRREAAGVPRNFPKRAAPKHEHAWVMDGHNSGYSICSGCGARPDDTPETPDRRKAVVSDKPDENRRSAVQPAPPQQFSDLLKGATIVPDADVWVGPHHVKLDPKYALGAAAAATTLGEVWVGETRSKWIKGHDEKLYCADCAKPYEGHELKCPRDLQTVEELRARITEVQADGSKKHDRMIAALEREKWRIYECDHWRTRAMLWRAALERAGLKPEEPRT